MAAGLGFKDFATGEVLTAADVDGYLMQGVWVFASAAARDAAVTSPQEGNFAYLKDTNVTTYYTGSTWANLDTTGMTNPMTTTGDTIYSSSGSTPARLGIGTAGQVLKVNSGATAPEWASSGGMTLISETVASANSGLTLGTISGSFKQLILVWNSVRHSGSGSAFGLRFNNDSGTNYYVTGFQGSGGTFTTNGTAQNHLGGSATEVIYAFGDNVNLADSTTDSMGYIIIDNYASSAKTKLVRQNVNYYDNTNGKYKAISTNSFYNSTTAITSLDVVRLSGSATFSNVNNGTIRLYGAA
jgi:hypothetical protein